MSDVSPLDDDDLTAGVGLDASRLQEFYIPVHGYVRLTPEEVAVVDHPAFQRLRKCRQLGFAHLVFPGAAHTRFEHSLGTLYVAEKMVQYVNFNYVKSLAAQAGDLPLCEINDDVRRFIRLAALLHDIGHIPYGHTLEDELAHLPKHDGMERINTLCWNAATKFEPRLELGTPPPEGWSLAAIINAAYAKPLKAMLGDRTPEGFAPFDLLKAIIGRAAPNVPAEIGEVFPLAVARDMVGNTICADFLDYLFRDWYHIGKPMTEDRRLYQYMEVRARCPERKCAEQQFVINIGPDRKLRHDALTCILELLEGRYKLAETVLFHRSKLSMTALLDRCFLELGHLFEISGIESGGRSGRELFEHLALERLVKCADDDLPEVIRALSSVVAGQVKPRKTSPTALRRPRKSDPALALEAPPAPDETSEREMAIQLERQFELVETLTRRLENRTTYTLASRFPRRGIAQSERYTDDRTKLPPRLEALGVPSVRRDQIRMIEEILGLEEGSASIYAPTDARMNAKLAEVKLLIGNEILSFTEYERREGALSCGMLKAQRDRFNELWGVSIYVERKQWAAAERARGPRLADALLRTIYINPQERERRFDLRAETTALDYAAAAQGDAVLQHSADDSVYKGRDFVSGLPFDRRQA